MDSSASQNVFVAPRLLPGMLRIFFQSMTGAYGASVAGFLLLRWLAGEDRLGLLAIFNHYGHLLVVPAVILLPLCLLLRFWRYALLLIPALAACALWNAPALLASPSLPATLPPRQITVWTHNLHALTTNLDDMAALIRDSGADVIAVQELMPVMAAHLAEALADAYPHQALHPRDDAGGRGIFSRFAIVEDAVWVPAIRDQQRALLDVDGVMVALYNVHLPFTPGLRAYQDRAADLDGVLSRAAQESAPVILAGDFNLTERAASYPILAAGYADVYHETAGGFGFTFNPLAGVDGPARWLGPVVRVDYVWAGAGLVPLAARVERQSAGSDHWPVWTRLGIVAQP